jgi:hypothetical protein
MAYLSGVGTAFAAVIAGVGGGVLVANIVSPHSPREMTKLERRMSPEPVPATNASLEPVPYLATTQAAAAGPVTVAPAPGAAQPKPAQQQPEQPIPQKTEAANHSSSAEQPPEAAAAGAMSAPGSAVPASPPPPAAAARSVSRESATSPQDAFAKARDADTKRVSLQKRHVERRQQWAEKRRSQRRQDQELRDVEQNVREETEPAAAFPPEPVRIEAPRIRFLEADD